MKNAKSIVKKRMFNFALQYTMIDFVFFGTQRILNIDWRKVNHVLKNAESIFVYCNAKSIKKRLPRLETWLIHMWHDSFMRDIASQKRSVTWLIHICDWWHNSFFVWTPASGGNDSLKLQVSFVKEPNKRDDVLLQRKVNYETTPASGVFQHRKLVFILGIQSNSEASCISSDHWAPQKKRRIFDFRKLANPSF